MKVGMNLLLWTDRPNYKEHKGLLKKIKDWGFDGVEFHINEFTEEDSKEFRKLCEDLGLKNTSTIALDASKSDPASEDPNKRQSAIDEIKKAVDNTILLGGNIIVGPLFQGLVRFSGKAPTKDEWNWAADCIREAGEYAKQAGVRLALEPLNRFEMYMVNTMADGYKFVNNVGLENIGLLADTFHSNIEEKNTVDAWNEAMNKIYHVHISENDRGIPGTGHAIPVEIFTLLKENNYDGWLTIEAFNDKVPGLISRLNLWRSYAARNKDIAIQGLKFIRENLKLNSYL